MRTDERLRHRYAQDSQFIDFVKGYDNEEMKEFYMPKEQIIPVVQE